MKYRCPACGYIYDEALGLLSVGIPPGTRWERLSSKWVCPKCKFPKAKFTLLNPAQNSSQNTNGTRLTSVSIEDVKSYENMHQMSYGELSALCSGLAHSCEIQYLFPEAKQFMILSDYYKAHIKPPSDASVDQLLTMISEDQSAFARADEAAETANDRGAMRILKWCEGATESINSVLSLYKAQGDQIFQNNSIYICEICGHIEISNTMPSDCPVCHVSSVKIQKVG